MAKSKKNSFKSLSSLVKSYFTKSDLLVAAVITVALIMVGLGLGWYNNRVVPINPAASAHYLSEPNNPLKFMSNWDGPNYLNIAQNGYTSSIQTNFFPLYPLIVRAVHYVIPSFLDSALLVSWICLVGAIYFYLKILRELFTGNDQRRTLQGLLLFILFPTAVFFLATYTESLFAFLALGAIYYALKKRYLLSAAFLGFCTATHITGPLVLALVAMILFEQKLKLSKIIANIVIGSLGLVAYMVFLAHKYHNAWSFITAQKSHGWLSQSYSSVFTTIDAFNLIFIILLIASIFYWWSRRKSFAIYSFLFLCIPIVGHQYGGFNRYVLMAFPVQFMLFNVFKNKAVGYGVIVVLSVIAWTYFLLQYAGGYVGG